MARSSIKIRATDSSAFLKRPTCIEAFCGAGGMSLGLMTAGFDLRYAFDIDAAAIQTYRNNIGNHAGQMDIRNLHGRHMLDNLDIDDLDLMSGGPPCQGFSKQRRGAHLENDDRNYLVMEYCRLLREARPKAFLFENVQVFGQKRGKRFIESIESELCDYHIYRFFVSASDFGIAQRRLRFMMIGVRRDVSSAVPVLARSADTLTVWDAIGDLPAPPEDYSEHPSIPNHIRCRISNLNELRFSHVPQGGGWADIPHDLRLACHRDVDSTKGGWPDVYGRLEWNGQAPTITAGFDSFTRGRYGHPEQHRSLTLREGARLQGFPDHFRFYGTRADIRLQIGNAVPPPLAKIAGEAVLRVIRPSDEIIDLPLFPEGHETAGASYLSHLPRPSESDQFREKMLQTA